MITAMVTEVTGIAGVADTTDTFSQQVRPVSRVLLLIVTLNWLGSGRNCTVDVTQGLFSGRVQSAVP